MYTDSATNSTTSGGVAAPKPASASRPPYSAGDSASAVASESVRNRLLGGEPEERPSSFGSAAILAKHKLQLRAMQPSKKQPLSSLHVLRTTLNALVIW